jgi:hypothetical protein
MASHLDRSPTHLLHRAKQAVELAFSMWNGSHDLMPRQFAVLLAIEESEGLSQPTSRSEPASTAPRWPTLWHASIARG